MQNLINVYVFDMVSDVHGKLLMSYMGGFSKNVITFGFDSCSSADASNRIKDILILGKSPTDGSDDTTTTAEGGYSVGFSEHGQKFYLCLHYNRWNSFLFVNGVKIHHFKAKDSKVNVYLLCVVGSISKDVAVDSMRKKGLQGCVYDFSVDYESTDVDDILDIHKYLMKTHNIK